MEHGHPPGATRGDPRSATGGPDPAWTGGSGDDRESADRPAEPPEPSEPLRPASRSPEHDLIGVDVGPYRIVEKLGAGGMGTVYKAVDRALDREVALKILFEVDEEANVRRFEQEARALAKITHPNTIQVFWIGEYRGFPCFAMEYIPEGISVYDLLRHKGMLPVDDAIDIIVQAAKGLNAAKRAGIVHRDIKPNNLLIDVDGTVKISDFGLAKLVESVEGHLTQSGIVMGTPYYMSPEQGQGEAIDHRSDLYSLGATFYHMITGFTPYEAQNPVSLIIKHVKDPIPDIRQVNPAIPDAIRRVIETCLEKDPLDRYQEYDELIQDLDGFREGQGLVNAPLVRPRRGGRMPSWVHFAAGLALAGAFVGGYRWLSVNGGSTVGPLPTPTTVAVVPSPVFAPTAPATPAATPEPGEIERARAEAASTDAVLRARAAATFGKLADAAAVPTLVELARRDPEARVRARAVWALGRLGGPQAMSALIASLQDADAGVVRQAISAVQGAQDVRLVEPLRAIAAGHEEADIRRAAARTVEPLFLEDPDRVFGDKPGTWWREQFRTDADRIDALGERVQAADRTVGYYRQRYGFLPGEKAPPRDADAEARGVFRTTYSAALAALSAAQIELQAARTRREKLIAAADAAQVPPDWRR